MGGVSVKISDMNNQLYIVGHDQRHKATLSIGESAREAGIDLPLMVKKNPGVGKMYYGVLLNGYNKQDWLFAVKIVGIL